jgi:DNA-binding NtrC family response regulator
MNKNEIYPPHRILCEYHSGNENLRIQKLNKKAPSLKLLLIDDDEHIRAKLCYFLNEKGYDVTSASNGSEGLYLIKNDRQGFDLIITDIVMPQMSGTSLISMVKKKFPDIPVIAITGWGEYPEAFATESQAEKVLSKPFELSELNKAINDLISANRQNVQD